MNKKVTAIGLTAGLIAGAGAGFLLETSGNAGASNNGSIVAAAAGVTANSTGTGGTGTDTAADQADHAARLQSILQPLVDDGTLTQAQADKVIAALQAAGPMGGGAMGGGHMGGDGDHGPGGGMRGAGLDSVATLLGITTDELRTALQGGQTLAQIAVAHGKTAQDVIDVLVADVTKHFADEVASGEHTQAEADQMIAAFTQQITDAVNNGGPVMGGRGHGDGDGDHGGLPGDGGNAGDSGSTGGTIDGGPSDSPTTSTGA